MCCFRWYHSGMKPPIGRSATLHVREALSDLGEVRGPQPVSPAK